MTELYERQNSLPLQIPREVIVVGCGGVGSWVAWMLAMTGVRTLWLFDHDTIEQHNLNRTPWMLEDVGKKKTVATAELIKRYRPDCTVYAAGKFLPKVVESLITVASYVVCATDSVASRKMVKEWAEGAGVSYLEVAAEGEMGSVTGEPAQFSTPEEVQVGYQSVPVWLGPAVGAALMAVGYICHNRLVGDKVLRMGWDGMENEFILFNSEFEYEQPTAVQEPQEADDDQ